MQVKLNTGVSKHRLIVPFLYAMLICQNSYAESGRELAHRKVTPTEPLLITLSSQKVQVGGDGKVTYSKADKVKPGDIVQYSAVYRNRSKSAIARLKASLPIPFGMQYVEKSSRPASVFATVDGIKYEAEPLVRTIKDKDGKGNQVAVPYSEYQSLRWEIGNLEAGKKIEVVARMQVNQLPKSAAELVAKPVEKPPIR
jgi:uncharacterized repeat protein (TIGR01451 family)